MFRKAIYAIEHPRPRPRLLPLFRRMFELEIAYRSSDMNGHPDDDGTCFENLYWCALFLYRIGDFDDLFAMWRAKNLNMDTGCGFDAQFFVGSGVDETISYLADSETPEAVELLQYIRANIKSESFDDMSRWLEFRLKYFEVDGN